MQDVARCREKIPVSINALTRAFDCPRFLVQAAVAHGLDEPGQRGKHIAIDQNREQQILDWIEQNAEEETRVMRGEIMNYYTSQSKTKSTRELVKSSVLHHSDEVIQTQSGREEERRAQVPRAFLERIIQHLHNYRQGCVAELVFNLDEVGIPDWEDRKTKKVIALAATFGQTIHHGVCRNVKHISVISCISATGESRRHSILTSQNASAVQEHLKKNSLFVSAGIAPRNSARSLHSMLASSSTISEPSSYHILIFFLVWRSPIKKLPSYWWIIVRLMM
jgi:hypothetical protein